MSNFKKYTPAELRALAQRIDVANDEIEAKRYGLTVKKVKIARNMKENADAMLSAFPNSKLADLVKDQVAAEVEAKAKPGTQIVPFTGKPSSANAEPSTSANAEPSTSADAEAVIAGELTDGTTVVVPKGEAKAEEYTEEDEKATKLGTEIAKWKKKNIETGLTTNKTVLEALYIDSIEQMSRVEAGKTVYYLHITGDAYDEGEDIDIPKEAGQAVIKFLNCTSDAMTKNRNYMIPVLQHITKLVQSYAPDDFPMKLGLKSRTVLLRHPNDKFGAESAPPKTGSQAIDLVDWEPNPVQSGSGLGYKAFTVSPSGKFGDAVIDPTILQLDKQLVAYVDGEEVVNEKVSEGLVSLFLSKTFNKKKVKQADIVRFMQLLDTFNFLITPHIKKTVKFGKLMDAVNDEEMDVSPTTDPTELLAELNRNIAAMQAGNKSGQLARDTFDILDALEKSEEVSPDRKKEYVREIAALIGL